MHSDVYVFMFLVFTQLTNMNSWTVRTIVYKLIGNIFNIMCQFPCLSHKEGTRILVTYSYKVWLLQIFCLNSLA